MNELSIPCPRLIMSLLEEHYYCVSRRPVVCRLWRMHPSPRSPVKTATYAIGLESPAKRYLYCVGTDETQTRALVKRILENKLEPIHLGNVVADYLWEMENSPVTEKAETED